MFGFFTHGWCHFPVIPTVFSEALSYEEDLSHVKCTLHKTIDELKKFEEFVRASFQEIEVTYLKITDANEKFLTKADAEATYPTFDYVEEHYLGKGEGYSYITQEEADQRYLQITDAQADYLTKQEAGDTYLPTATAQADYLKKSDAQATYLTQVEAGQTYLTQSNAGLTYLDKAAAQMYYLTKKEASDTYLTSTGAAGTYLTKTEASDTYLTKTDAQTEFEGIDQELHTLDMLIETAQDDIVNLGNMLTAAGVLYIDSVNGNDKNAGTSWTDAIQTGEHLLAMLQEVRYQQIRRVYLRGSITIETAFRFRDIVFTASEGYDCKVEFKLLDHYGHIYVEGVATEPDRSELILNNNAIEGTLHVKYGTLVCNKEITLVNGSLYLEYGVQTGSVSGIASSFYYYNSNVDTVRLRTGDLYVSQGSGNYQVNNVDVFGGSVFLNSHAINVATAVPITTTATAVIDNLLVRNAPAQAPANGYFDFGTF